MMTRHGTSAVLLDHWNEARSGAPFALRRAIEPSKLSSILPLVFLLERHDGNLTFRLAGTSICTLYGLELRGCDFALLWHVASRESALAAAIDALDESKPLGIDMIVEAQTDAIRSAMLLLPLSADGMTPDRFIGTIDLSLLEESRLADDGPITLQLMATGDPLAKATETRGRPTFGRWGSNPSPAAFIAPHRRQGPES